MNRTPDLLITNELLYRLSYTGNLLSAALDYSVKQQAPHPGSVLACERHDSGLGVSPDIENDRPALRPRAGTRLS